MIKPILTILLTSLIAFNLTACGKSSEEKRIEKEQKSAQEFWEKRRQ